MRAARVHVGLEILQDALHIPGLAQIVGISPVKDVFGRRYVEMTIEDPALPDVSDDDIPLLTSVIHKVEWDWGLK